MKNKRFIVLITFVFLAVFFTVSFADAATINFKYRLLEQFPGFFQKGEVASDLKTLISALYKFGVWTVGIAATLMLVIGGFMYMTSAGNTSKAGSAKGVITDALIGMVVALGSYLLFYVINPDLVKMSFNIVQVEIKTDNKGEACGAYDGGQWPGFSESTPSACLKPEIQTLFNQVATQQNRDKCIVEALAATESGCELSATNRNPNGTTDCGIVQINSSNFSAGQNCQTYINNPTLGIVKALNLIYSIQCISNYPRTPLSNITAPVSTIRINPGYYEAQYNTNQYQINMYIRDLYAGYNGGCGVLTTSNSCSSNQKNAYGYPYKKWDCPSNMGGLCNVPMRTSKFLNYYTQCKNR